MANQIDSVKNVIGTVAESNADTLKSVQDVKNAADRSYLIGMVGIGAGIAGIVIAAFSLSRKRVILT
jgi:HSP90 family molecular chaperone